MCSNRDEIDTISEEVVTPTNPVACHRNDKRWELVVHSLIVAVFVAFFAATSGKLRLPMLPQSECSEASGYSRCDLSKDARSILSFLVGVIICRLVLVFGQADDEEERERAVDEGEEEQHLCTGSWQIFICWL
eukprot:TRINITY_DN73729_c0_g1_i1.p2 TRINITY_DN73729_c0_g1~~TRINITY_DN73729_c0_g1_i1.p2  ORF type:complete len:133 (+),score=21.90 TRINITY_DN73729_c0_g1_i1:114-512(+)